MTNIEDKCNYDDKSEGAAPGVTRKLTVRSGDVEHAGGRPPGGPPFDRTAIFVRRYA